MKSWFICSILSLVLLVGAYLPVAADLPLGDTCVWTGAADDNWHNPANWGCGHVPGPNDQAIVPPVSRRPRIYPQPAAFAGSVAINGGATLALDPNAALTVSTDVTLDRSAELFPGANSTITLRGGSWTNNGGHVPVSTAWTAVFGGLDDQQINGAAATQTFHNLTVNNSSMTVPSLRFGGGTATVIINGALTLNEASTLDTGVSSVLNLLGNLYNNGGTLLGNAVVIFGGGLDQLIGGSTSTSTLPGPVTVDKTAGKVTLGDEIGALVVGGPLTLVRGMLNLRGKNLTTIGPTTIGPGTLDLDSMWTANEAVTLGPSGVFLPGSGTVTLSNGNWTNNGGKVVSSAAPWTLLLNGPGNQEINGTATTQSFGNLTLYNPTMGLPEVQVGGSATTLNVAGTLTIGPDTTFDAGTLRNLAIGAGLINNGGSFVGSTQLNVKLNGAGRQVIGGTAPSQTIPGNLWVEGPAPEHAVVFGGSTTKLTVNGALEVTGGAFNLGPNTLITHGPADIFKVGMFNLGSGVWNSLACIYLETSGTLNMGSGTINFFGGTFGFYGGSLVPGTGTTNFHPHGSQTIGGMGDATALFHHVGIFNDTMGPATLSIGSSGHGPSAFVATGDVTIGDSATLDAGTANGIRLGGNLSNDGDFVPRASTVTFNGSAPLRSLDAAQTIGGARPTAFNGLTIDNPAGVILGASQTVSGTLDLKAGDLTTAAHILSLGSAATVTGTHAVIGAVQRTQAFTAGVPYGFGQADLTITFAGVGSVTGLTVNSQAVAPDGLRPAIPRTVTITPVGAGYNATLRLPYRDAELGGIAEGDLRLWQREGLRWVTHYPQVGNTSENWIEQGGITAFSMWALAPLSAGQGGRVYLPLVRRR